MGNNKDGLLNAGFSVWVSICVFICFWLWNMFTKGRRRFQNNLHVIEEGLRKMQADIELRQRENSVGCVEDVEDISEFLKKFYDEGNNEKTDEEPEVVPSIVDPTEEETDDFDDEEDDEDDDEENGEESKKFI